MGDTLKWSILVIRTRLYTGHFFKRIINVENKYQTVTEHAAPLFFYMDRHITSALPLCVLQVWVSWWYSSDRIRLVGKSPQTGSLLCGVALHWVLTGSQVSPHS